MEQHKYQTLQPYRANDQTDAQRLLYAGFLSAIGIVLAIAHVLHGFQNLQEGIGLAGLALGAVAPFFLSASLVAMGYWLLRSDLPVPQLRRIVGWFLFGVVGILLLTGTGVIYQRFHGVQMAHLSFVLLNFATGGGIVGIVVGWYDGQNKLQTEQLRVFQKTVEHSGHAIYMTAPDGTIEYVNPEFEEQSGHDWEDAVGEDPSILRSDEHDEEFYEELWETILDGEIWTGEVINQDSNGEKYVVNQTVAPVTDEDGTIERFVAINADITEQKRRQDELERQRDELAQLHQLTATMWEVTQALVSAATESELQQQVCDALVSTEFCDAAWLGTYDGRTETLSPDGIAGFDETTLDTLQLDDQLDADVTLPCREAVAEREVSIAEWDTDSEMLVPWETGESSASHQIASIPIVQEELVYGTLTLYSTRPRAFNEDERAQLAELGDAVAHGLDSIKTRKLLHADQIVELEFRSHDERDFFVDVSVKAGCTISLSGTVPLSDDRALLYVTLEDGDVEALREVAAAREDVEQTRLISDDDEKRLTVVVEPEALIAKRLMDLGAQIERASATDGELTILANLPPNQDVRSIVEEVQDRFPDLELIAKRETEREGDDEDRSIQTELSERQRAALYAAYHAGYFKSPRESTAEEIASEMGISGPTFHKHLRRALRTLLGRVLDAHPQGLGGDQPQELNI